MSTKAEHTGPRIRDGSLCSPKDIDENIYRRMTHIYLKLYSLDNSQVNTIWKKFKNIIFFFKNIILNKNTSIKKGHRTRFHFYKLHMKYKTK